MPLGLVTHTQTLIDSLWEINMATESQLNPDETSQAHTTTAATIIKGLKEVLNII